jgi:hypothetical protein
VPDRRLLILLAERERWVGWFGGDEVRRSKRWYGYGYGGGYLARWYDDAAGGGAVVVLPWGQLGTTWEDETLLCYWTSWHDAGIR